jgi:probable HAF family extracellular repeat protein
MATTYTYTTLDDPSAGTQETYTFADSINDSGQVAGYYLDSNAVSHGFVYSNGTYTTLNGPAGAAGTLASRCPRQGYKTLMTTEADVISLTEANSIMGRHGAREE